MRLLATSVCLAALSRVALAAGVWVVGPGGLPSIGDAIDLAADGDVILVRAGTYPGFAVTGKSLVIAGDTGPAPDVQGSVAVSQLAAGQTVTFQHLQVQGSPGAAAVLATDNAGALWIEDCSISGTYGGASSLPNPGIGLRAKDCASLHVRRSTIAGASGPGLAFAPGSDAVSLTSSETEVFSCTFQGGRGGPAAVVSSCSMETGGTGGTALRAEGSKVLFQSSAALGGNGGIGAKCDLGAHICGVGGDAGAGAISGAGSEISSVQSVFFGGFPGWGGSFLCDDGEFGFWLELLGGTFAELPYTPQTLTASPLLREGELAEVTATGQPSLPCAIYASFEPAAIEVPSVYGDLLLAPPLIALGAVLLPADGKFVIQAPVPELGPAVAGLTLRVQTAVLPLSGGVVFGEGATLVFLDAGL